MVIQNQQKQITSILFSIYAWNVPGSDSIIGVFQFHFNFTSSETKINVIIYLKLNVLLHLQCVKGCFLRPQQQNTLNYTYSRPRTIKYHINVQ